ncbi:conserved hypothetical protein [Trichormus variabilis ATCC 29413]|uniref:Uncharacterized protein n=2 Tax=Anabaena variabilis TaxID=264691 RepID=Q3M4Q4_TRIV2|nr:MULTISPECIES: hypothetical protein [Nostocaceae]ABA24032.1 conserved hypothetical protein [Trichormus variabilis ATCC 29413]MBC1213222.1 hypothetical protein [Trichormus variabilis ARAD]MBC1256168.1 hypothetical protein [Trichormus variabilis V5]MBC1267371.1 hypothetical protein [Trichormus variabilis FSR]MBC1300707.1 hypothetical protein [Trichormus variabilis N2B]
MAITLLWGGARYIGQKARQQLMASDVVLFWDEINHRVGLTVANLQGALGEVLYVRN